MARTPSQRKRVDGVRPVQHDCAIETLLEQPALNFGGERHDVADLVLVGLLTGHWPAVEVLAARGLGLEAERSDQVSAEELEADLAAFRYERRLIAAAELREWLSRRALDIADFAACCAGASFANGVTAYRAPRRAPRRLPS